MAAGPDQLMVAAWNRMWMSLWKSRPGKGGQRLYAGHMLTILPRAAELLCQTQSLKAWASILEVTQSKVFVSFEVRVSSLIPPW